MKKLLIVLILILMVLGVGYLAFYSNKYAPNGQSANVAEGQKNYDFNGKGANGAVSLKSFEGKFNFMALNAVNRSNIEVLDKDYVMTELRLSFVYHTQLWSV